MADFVLHDGREITFDLYAVTMADLRSLFDNNQTDEEGDAIIGKSIGMSGEEYAALPVPDYRLIATEFFKKVRAAPDPN